MGHLDLRQLFRHPREEGRHHALGTRQTDAKDRSDCCSEELPKATAAYAGACELR